MPTTPLQDALASATQTLSAQTHAERARSARLDAQILLCHVLGIDRATLFAHPERTLTADQQQRYQALIERRARGEPVAYLTGHKEFFGLDLLVDPRVLIPRPETELLVEAALCACREKLDAGHAPVVADIGTGSGAIPIALAVHEPRLPRLYATDISPDALEVAALNCRRFHVEERVHLLLGDLTDPLPEPVEVMTANLPYIGTDDSETLEDDVRNYEPRQALFSGSDGLEHIERLFTKLERSGTLLPGSVLLLEIGYAQRETLARLLQRLWPQATIAFMRDYAGWDRVMQVAF
jgi:release factor glutamine methyltransferase